jgi:hypothetical protein
MKMRPIVALAALVVLVLAVAPATAEKKTKVKRKKVPFDYKAYFTNLPRMQKITEQSNKNIKTLHTLMGDLGATKSEDDAKANLIRAKIRRLLTNHRKLKLEMIGLSDKALKKPKPARTDVQALRALRKTELTGVRWSNTFLMDVAKEMAEAIEVPIYLANSVQELNRVNLDFDTIAAEAVMDIICSNFGLKYLVYGGEICMFRRLNRNEERFLAYEKKTGKKVDWIAEDAAGTYDSKDMPKDKRKKRELKKLEDMDLPLLQQEMVKMYILEGESKRHEIRLKELKLAAEFLDMMGKIQESKESEKDKEKRHRHVTHYVRMERDNAIEVWDVINRVLGDVLVVPEDDEILREILKKEIALVEWKDVDVEAALYELGRLADVEVEVDFPDTDEMYITLTAENMTVQMIIDFICNEHDLDWRFVNGKLFFATLESGNDDE